MATRPDKIRPASPRVGVRRARKRRGQGVLEAALVLPVLLAVSLGMVEFGQLFFFKHNINAAARDGARTSIVPSATHQQAVAAVDSTMNAAGFAKPSYTVTFTEPASGTAIADIARVSKGSGIRVTVTAEFGKIGVRPLGVISANKPVVGITTMLKE